MTSSKAKSINVKRNKVHLEVQVLSAPAENMSDWVYRIFDRRTIAVKARNDQVRKIAAMDLQTNVPIAIDVPQEVSLDGVKVEQSYYASLKVYTSRNVAGVPPDLANFFTVLDVDQSIEDFVKAYWLYPKLIRFELVELEPL